MRQEGADLPWSDWICQGTLEAVETDPGSWGSGSVFSLPPGAEDLDTDKGWVVV